MLYNRPETKNAELKKVWGLSDEAHGVGGSKLPRAGTLLVLPTVAIRQWQLEIARFTAENSLTVKVYHGADRSLSVNDLLAYDIIVTSYKVSGGGGVAGFPRLLCLPLQTLTLHS